MSKDIRAEWQTKNSRGTYETTHTTTDAAQVYERLALDLVAKKVNACSYIKSIKRRPNYNGTCEITVTYDNRTRALYTIADH